jgi:hypothetical protein
MHADPADAQLFIQRAQFFHRQAIDTLGTMPSRTFARPLVILLSHGYRQPLFDDASRIRQTPPPPDVRFPPPEPFEPQKSVAMRRAKLAAFGIAAIGAAVIALLVWQLF